MSEESKGNGAGGVTGAAQSLLLLKVTDDRKSLSASASPAAKKVIIKSADMKEDMQKEAVDIAISAFEKYGVEKDVAEQIKKEFDKKHGPTWHCIVGKNLGSYVTHETNHFVYFYLDSKAVLLFKSVLTPPQEQETESEMSSDMINLAGAKRKKRSLAASNAQSKRFEDGEIRNALLAGDEADDAPIGALVTQKRARSEVSQPDTAAAAAASASSSPLTEEAVKAMINGLFKGVKPFESPSLPKRTEPEMLLGVSAARRAMDHSIGKELRTASEHYEARMRPALLELADVTYQAIREWKAAQAGHRNALSQVQVMAGQLELLHARLAEAKAEKEVAVRKAKRQRVELEGEVAQTEAALQDQIAQLTKVKAALRAAKEVERARAVEDFKNSTAFHELLTEKAKGFAKVGAKHFLRCMMVDPQTKDLISVEKAADLFTEEYYDDAARAGHAAVPFDENDLMCIRAADDAAGLPAWVPPPVIPQNFDFVCNSLLEDDDEPAGQ